MSETTADRNANRWTPRLIFQRRNVYSWGTTWYTREWVTALWITVATVSTLTAILWGCVALSEKSCSNSAEVLETKYRFKVIGGCYLQVENGRFVPEANYRITENL